MQPDPCTNTQPDATVAISSSSSLHKITEATIVGLHVVVWSGRRSRLSRRGVLPSCDACKEVA